MSDTPAFDGLFDELRSCGAEFERFLVGQCEQLQEAHARVLTEQTVSLRVGGGDAQRQLTEQSALRLALEERVDGYLRQIELLQAELAGLAGRADQQRGEDAARRQQLEDRLQAAQAATAEALAQRDAMQRQAAEHAQRLAAFEGDLEQLREQAQAAAAAQAAADRGAAKIAELETALAQAQAAASQGSDAALAEMRVEKADLLNRLSALEKERVGWLGERRMARAQANAVSEQSAKLIAAQEQLNQARAQFAEQRQAMVTEREQAEEALARRAEQVERELADLRRELDHTRAQAARADQTAVALASARAELAQAREEIALLRTQPCEGGASPQVVSELEHERALLESELEMIRNRAAELTESLAEEKRRMSQERAEWTGELKQLRKTLASQALGVDVAAARPGEYPPAASRSSAATDSGAHAVLDSVMAQFELLQKDRQRRRAGHQDVA